MNLDNDEILENETLELEEEPGEIQENEEPGENLEETQAETQEQIDYTQDFVMLENLTFIQVSLMGVLVFYFVLSLVVKFIKSFF